MRVLQILALGAQLAAAISFTDPAANSTLTRGSTFDLTWSSVDTDPSTFSVYLVNFVNWPPYYEQLDLDLETTAGEASVRIPCDVDDSYGYQFNAINGTNVYIIYAQTPIFSITGDSCTDPAPTAPTCAAASTVTVTVRGSHTSTSGPYAAITSSPQVGKVAAAWGTNSSTTTVITSAAASVATAPINGVYPSTIGWNGSYTNPIVVPNNVPRAGGAVETAATTTSTTTFMTVPTSAPTLVGAEVKAVGSKKGCKNKKRASRMKRHSDGDSAAHVRKAQMLPPRM